MGKIFELRNHGYLMKKMNKFSSYISSSKNSFENAQKELTKILNQLRGSSETITDANTMPGKFFRFHHPEIMQNDIEGLFGVFIKESAFVEKYEILVARAISQLAAYDFVYFVSNIVPIFIEVPDVRIQHLYVSVCRIICDPTTGFLRNAPLNQRNKQPDWNERTYFDFFSFDSPFLKSPFGHALIELRGTITKIIQILCKDPYPTIKTTKIPTVYVQSFMFSVQTIIVPPKFREFHLSCEFPGRIEMLLALSAFQDRTQFQKAGGFGKPPDKLVVEAWQTYYEGISGFKSLVVNKSIEISTKMFSTGDASKTLLFRFLKLSLLTCLDLKSFPFERVGDFVMHTLLCSDNPNMLFIIPWCQALISLHKDAAKHILNSICEVFANYNILSSSQQYTLFHMVARFLDLYVCTDDRSLTRDQMLTIVVYSILGLCSNHPTVRQVAMKVMVSIGRFNEDEKTIMFDEFINKRSKPIIMHFLSFLDRQPASILSTCPRKPYLLLNFDILMESTNQTLWQLYLAAIALEAATFYPEDLLRKIITELEAFIDKCKSLGKYQKILLINALTIIASLTEINYSSPEIDHTDKLLDYIVGNQDILMTGLSSRAKSMFDVRRSPVTLLTTGLSYRAFSKLVSRLQDVDHRISSLLLLSMAWSKGFGKAADQPDFLKKFLGAFRTASRNVVMEDHIKSPKGSDEWLMIYCATAYKLFEKIMEKFSTTKVTPFPSMPFVMDTQKHEIQSITAHFDKLFEIATKAKGNTRLFAIHALYMWFLCCKHPDETKVCNPQFLETLFGFTDGVPNIFSGLLSHHFEVLFPLFLERAILLENGDAYFKAICDFFRPTIKKSVIEADKILSDYIWRSCSPIEKGKSLKYLQVIYENWGTVILASIHYMARPQKALTDEAFILLATLTPVIYLFRMKGRTDKLSKIFDFFIHTCRQFSTLTLIDDPAILTVSKRMRDLFPFTLEQVLFYLMEIIKNPVNLRSTLKYFLPWFNLVVFDYENRVISRETELRFMKFSCFAFVDKVFSTVSHLSSDNPNAANNDIWRALCVHVRKEDKKPYNVMDNIRGIIFAIKEFNDTVKHVLRYIYTIADKEVLDYITSYLTYEYSFYKKYKENDLLNGPSDSHFDFFAKQADQQIAPLNVLTLLCEDAIKPIFPYLPRILSYCVIFKYIYPEQTSKLINTIFTGIKPYIQDRTLQIADDIISRFSLLPDASAAHEFKDPNAPNMIKPAQISLLFWKFLNQFSQSNNHLDQEYSLLCLKWGLCSCDLAQASIALKCFKGAISFQDNKEVYDSVFVGICARCLSNISHALNHLLNVKHDYTDTNEARVAVTYFKTLIQMLKYVAIKMHSQKILVADSGIFWMAMESLKCNTAFLSEIFNAGISVLEFFFNNPQLFECISDQHHYNGTQFTLNTFWKFHKAWGDRFPGCYKYILGFAGEIESPERFFNILNLMVQLRCPALFSNSEVWMYTALLSLMPWMWSVVITDISRFLTKTPKVIMMQNTVRTLCDYIDDDKVKRAIEKLFSVNKMALTEDMFTLAMNLVEMVMNKIDQDDIPIICKFFTNCLKSGSRSLIVPLYTIATSIVKFAKNKKEVFDAISRFIDIALEQENSDPDIKLYTQLFTDELEAQMALEDIDDTMLRSESCSTQSSDIECISFPDFNFFDRIVAILVPRLHECGSPDPKPQTFATIQQFPLMNPCIDGLEDCERFTELTNIFKQIQVDPFSQNYELCTKMRSTFIDTEALKMMRETEKVDVIKIDEIIKSVLDNEHDDTKSAQGDVPRATHEGEEEDQQETKEEQPEELSINLELFTFPVQTYLPDMNFINELDRMFFMAEEEQDYDNMLL